MLRYRMRAFIITGIVCTVVSWGVPSQTQEIIIAEAETEEVETEPKSTEPAAAVTTKDPEIPVEALELLLKPLTQSELENEAAAWQVILQQKVQEISDTEIAITYPNITLNKQREAAALAAANQAKAAQKLSPIDRAKQVLEQAKQERENLDTWSYEYEEITAQIERLEIAIETFEYTQEIQANTPPDTWEYDDATQQLEGARDSLKQATEAIEAADTTPSNSTEQSSRNLNQAANVLGNSEIEGNIETKAAIYVDGLYSLQNISQEQAQLEGVADSELKKQLIEKVTQLKAERKAIIERFETVLDELEIKGGEVKSYREYIEAVSKLNINLKDAEGLGTRLMAWLTSGEGGIRLAIDLILFTSIIVASIFLSRFLARVANKSLLKFGDTSELFREFVVTLVRRGGIVVGCLIGLTTIGVSLGPVLALVGGASFILAFALQSNLANLASGLMLMVYKPFDTGDEVKIGDLWGFVDSITLASTKIKGFTQEIITIPNDTVWGSTIKNLTAGETRKGSIAIRSPFNQKITEVERILVEIGESHPLILKAAPFIWEYAEYYVTINFGFVVKTSDFWTVWGDIHRIIQERFEQEGMEIALPTQIEIEKRYDDQLKQLTVDAPVKSLQKSS